MALLLITIYFGFRIPLRGLFLKSGKFPDKLFIQVLLGRRNFTDLFYC